MSPPVAPTSTGTPETCWQEWTGLGALPPLALPAGRVVVVSAHPDDEVLGAGGLIAALAATSATLSFVTVTDGEASHPDVAGIPSWLLAARRTDELGRALAALGVVDPQICRLRLPDSAVASHTDVLADGLAQAGCGSADLVICPAVVDGHIDHSTVASVTRQVCADLAPVWEFPIWVWHWTTPGEAAVPWDRAGRFELSPAQTHAKKAALDCFDTQIRRIPGDASETTILPPEVLAHFARPFEVFFT